ncbi:LacI family DNA-binding transcriptional regulator [Streptomyces sp. CA2R106]|uniref:LacI family DNA-binding transcriptional regulator n=1 Tax=Streptomyces sp. CA2R106 TaxID=3120153 RepID=UPI003008C316
MGNPRSPRRPTQADVARLAEVSPSVVSAVVNGRHDGAVRASEPTVRRVWEAVRKLGYSPNLAARSLAGGRNNIVGVFTYEAVFPTDRLSFFHDSLTGIEEAAEELDCHLLLFTGSRGRGQDGGRRRAIFKDGVNTLQVTDGAVLLGQDEDREELSALVASGFPFVYIGRRELSSGEMSYVTADYAAATRGLVERCAGLGHRRLALLRSTVASEAVLERETGYFEACRGHAGVESGAVHLVEPDAVATDLLATLADQGVTCVVTDDSNHAASVRSGAIGLGLRVPEDLSVVALGDFAGSRPDDPTITSLLTPRREMGGQAVRLLADLLARPQDTAPRRAVATCGTRPGQTLKAPPAR